MQGLKIKNSNSHLPEAVKLTFIRRSEMKEDSKLKLNPLSQLFTKFYALKIPFSNFAKIVNFFGIRMSICHNSCFGKEFEQLISVKSKITL